MKRLDEKQKTILIIKQKMTTLQKVEAFLSKRDWQIFVAREPEVAIEIMVKENPLFIMVPVDHPDKRIGLIPAFAQKLYSCCPMWYSELLSTKSLHSLNNLNTDYILPVPVSGLAVERMANRYLNLRAKKQAQNGKKLPSYYVIANGQSKSGETMTQEQASLRINALIEVLNQASGAMDNGLSSTPSSLEIPSMSGAAPLRTKSNLDVDQSEKAVPEARSAAKGKAAEEYYHLLKRSIKSSISDFIEPGANREGRPLGVVSNVACLIVDSTLYKGYLVIATGRRKALDAHLMHKLQVRLAGFLEQGHVSLNKRDVYNLFLKPVAFESWSQKCAEFLFKTLHQGDTVAMAFFPREDIHHQESPSASEDMVALSLEYFSEDSQSEFDIYLYFPLNKRYLLYTPSGATLYKSQTINLQKKGVTHFHIRRSDLPEFKKFRIQSHLNAKIEPEFQA